jgi:hypothetical protein
MDVELGTIVLPSGLLVVGDMGYLGDWFGEGEPAPPQFEDPELAARAAEARDMRFTGPDAAAAAEAFDRQSQTYLYDVAPEDMLRLYEEAVGDRFDARLEEEPRRIPHAERARRAAQEGADFLINGVWFFAIGGLPAGRPLRVLATPHDQEGRWESVTVEVEADVPMASTEELGWVGVDWARLIFADLDCLNAWEHETPLDGRAEVAFWGADAGEAAWRFSAAELPEGVRGWEDLPMEEAAGRAIAIEEWAERKRKRVVVDFRPHSHHYAVMRAVRAFEHEAGTLDLAGGRVLGMMTTWGDGVFGVEVDRDESGTVVAVRVLLAPEDS